MTASVLVVDDDGDYRETLVRLLRVHGFEVHEAEDGSEALGTLETQDPDVMLMDVQMPGMTGIEVLERVGGKDELTLHALDCLGDCYLKRRDVGNATRVFQQLATISPQDQRGIVGLARCATATGDYAKAETMLHEIVDPRRSVYPPAYVALAEAHTVHHADHDRPGHRGPRVLLKVPAHAASLLNPGAAC